MSFTEALQLSEQQPKANASTERIKSVSITHGGISSRRPSLKARVMVCDDEHDIRNVFSMALKRQCHCDVVQACSGQECVKRYAESIDDYGSDRFDAIVSDNNLGDAKGCDVAREIRRREAGGSSRMALSSSKDNGGNDAATTKILMVSASLDCTTAERLVADGIVDGLLEKPVRMKQLADKAGRLIASGGGA